MEKEFYFSILNGREYLIYSSDIYKLTELDIINLIKILLIEKRSISIGKRVLSMYRDASDNEESQRKLKLIGITENGTTKPFKEKKPVIR